MATDPMTPDISLPAYQPYVPPTATASPSAPMSMPAPQAINPYSNVPSDLSQVDPTQLHAPANGAIDAFRNYSVSQGNDPAQVDKFLGMVKAARDAKFQMSIMSMKYQQDLALQQAGKLKQQEIDIQNDPGNVLKQATTQSYMDAVKAQAEEEAKQKYFDADKQRQIQLETEKLSAEHQQNNKDQADIERSKNTPDKINAKNALSTLKADLAKDPGIVNAPSYSFLPGFARSLTGAGQKASQFGADISALKLNMQKAGLDVSDGELPKSGDTPTLINQKMDALELRLKNVSDPSVFGKSSTKSTDNTQSSSQGGTPNGPTFSGGGAATSDALHAATGKKLTDIGNMLNPNAAIGNAIQSWFVDPAVNFAKGTGQAIADKINQPMTNQIATQRDAQNALMMAKAKAAPPAKAAAIYQNASDYNQRSADNVITPQINNAVQGQQNSKGGLTTIANLSSLIPGGGIVKSLAQGALYGYGASKPGEGAKDAAIGAATAGVLHAAGATLEKLLSPLPKGTPLPVGASSAEKFTNSIENVGSAEARIPRSIEGKTIQNTFNLSPTEAKRFKAPAMTEKLAQNGFAGLSAEQMSARANTIVEGTTRVVNDAVGKAMPVPAKAIKSVAETADTLLDNALESGLSEKQVEVIRTNLQKGLGISTDRGYHALPETIDPAKVLSMQKMYQEKAAMVAPGNAHAGELRTIYRSIATELSDALHEGIQQSPQSQQALQALKDPEIQQALRRQGFQGFADELKNAKSYQDVRHALEPFVKGSQMLDLLEFKGPKGVGVRRAASSAVGAIVGGVVGHAPGAVVGQAVAPAFEPLLDTITSELQPRISGGIVHGAAAIGKGVSAASAGLQNPQVQRSASGAVRALDRGGGRPGMDITDAVRHHPHYLYK